jgi:hypothetical protein
MGVNKAVVVDPQLPPREILLDESYDADALIGCDTSGVSIPGYFQIFSDPSGASYRKSHNIPDNYDSKLCMVHDDNYLNSGGELNKICSDLYSACRLKPWPVLGTAIIEYCSLDQLKFMYDYIQVYLPEDPRIEDEYKQIVLSRDASAYDVVLNNLDDYA